MLKSAGVQRRRWRGLLAEFRDGGGVAADFGANGRVSMRMRGVVVVVVAAAVVVHVSASLAGRSLDVVNSLKDGLQTAADFVQMRTAFVCGSRKSCCSKNVRRGRGQLRRGRRRKRGVNRRRIHRPRWRQSGR